MRGPIRTKPAKRSWKSEMSHLGVSFWESPELPGLTAMKSILPGNVRLGREANLDAFSSSLYNAPVTAQCNPRSPRSAKKIMFFRSNKKTYLNSFSSGPPMADVVMPKDKKSGGSSCFCKLVVVWHQQLTIP